MGAGTGIGSQNGMSPFLELGRPLSVGFISLTHAHCLYCSLTATSAKDGTGASARAGRVAHTWIPTLERMPLTDDEASSGYTGSHRLKINNAKPKEPS